MTPKAPENKLMPETVRVLMVNADGVVAISNATAATKYVRADLVPAPQVTDEVRECVHEKGWKVAVDTFKDEREKWATEKKNLERRLKAALRPAQTVTAPHGWTKEQIEAAHANTLRRYSQGLPLYQHDLFVVCKAAKDLANGYTAPKAQPVGISREVVDMIAELIYLRKYGKDGAIWSANESKDVWRDQALALLTDIGKGG